MRTTTSSRFARFMVVSSASVLCLLSLSVQAGGTLTIVKSAPFAHPDQVRAAIKAECKLSENIPEYVRTLGSGYDAFKLGSAGASGDVLELKITQAHGIGGGWHATGRRVVSVHGTLKRGGKVVGTVEAQRGTARGKRVCQSLDVAAKAVAKDIGQWLAKPTMNARMGELK